MTKILVIEDDSLLLEFLEEVLKREGFKVFVAGNGDKGIKYARKHQPDLILSDINMPGISGHEVLRQLQRDSDTQNIPFIFLSGKVEMEDLREGMSLGADDYLMKPVQIPELIKAVRTRLKKHRELTKKYRDEITRTMENLEKTINYDEFTGLPKKAVLEKRIKEIRLGSSFENSVALMIIRLDRFRGISDEMGSSLIKQVVERIKKTTRIENEIFWLEGDEFGLFLPNNPDEKKLVTLAGKIIKNIRKTFMFDKQEFHFGASIGVSRTQIKSLNFTRLLAESELALNYAIEQGYSNFQFFEPQMKKHVFQRIRLEGALHRAVENNEFVIYYQPKYQLSDEKLAGIEALVRWEHEEFGMVSPAQFIPIAETNGLINEIGDCIIHWLSP